MPELPLLLVLIVAVALLFDFTNGAHDSANAIATVVSTKVLSPRTAVLMAAGLNLIGAMLGDQVATTLGKGVVNPDMLNGSQLLVLGALLGAIAWNLITWYAGIPSSSSHAAARFPGRISAHGTAQDRVLAFYPAQYQQFRPSSSDMFGRVHGRQSWTQRRAENHGHHYAGALSFWRD